MNANNTRTSVSLVLPARISFTITIYSPELISHSSTSAITDVDPTTTTTPSPNSSTSTDASQTLSTISAPQSSSLPSQTTSATSTNKAGVPTTYTAVMPAIFGAFVLISCLFFFRRYRNRRNNRNNNKTDEPPSMICKAWSRLSTLTPSSSHPTLRPEDSLSQRHSFERGRSMNREASEARRTSLLQRARERFIQRESAMKAEEV